jgi:hypothetical protein
MIESSMRTFVHFDSALSNLNCIEISPITYSSSMDMFSSIAYIRLSLRLFQSILARALQAIDHRTSVRHLISWWSTGVQ